MPMHPRWHWCLLGLLLVAEFLLFDVMTSRHHAWVYPRWNDQIQYLTEAYTSHEQARQHGLWAGVREAALNPAAQGTMHDIAAVLVFAVAGPSRSAALSLNILAFLAWQFATFVAWRQVSGRWAVAWCGAGLLLCLHVLVDVSQGSPVDFRLDWLACCAMGLVASAGLLTNGLRHTGWTVAWGTVVGLTILTRFMTAAYFGAMFVLLLMALLFGLLGASHRRQNMGRLWRLLLAGMVASAVSLPLLWRNREWVLNYYWIGHLTGPESAIRSPEFGLGRSLTFVLHDALWQMHLGPWFGWTAVGALTALGVGVISHRRTMPGEQKPLPMLGPALWLGALLFLIPMVVLTLHGQKSLHVESILIPGILTLLFPALTTLNYRLAGAPSPWQRLPVLVAIAVVLAGIAHFATRLARNPHTPDFVASARKVNEIADYLHATSRSAGLMAPRVGVDQITDCLDGQIMRVICYERQHDWMPFMMTLPTGIAEDREEQIWERVRQSDFILLTDEPGVQGFWPFDHQMRRLYPSLKTWCDSHLRPVEKFQLFGRAMTLYQRPELPFQPVRR